LSVSLGELARHVDSIKQRAGCCRDIASRWKIGIALKKNNVDVDPPFSM